MNRLFLRRFSYLVIAFATMGLLKTLLAKHVSVKSQKRFYKLIQNPRYNLAIAMFYQSNKMMRCESPHFYERMKRAKSMFKNASAIFKYSDADLMFITVNTLDKNNAVFLDAYEIKGLPTYILFKDGQPFTDKAGNMVKLSGFVTRPQLQKFIDMHYSKPIEKNRARNRKIRERKIEENLARSYYWGWGWGGYPYWGGCGGWGGCWGGYGGCGWGRCGRSRCGRGRCGC